MQFLTKNIIQTKSLNKMDAINSYLQNIKTNIMKKMLNFTDSEYYLLKFKPDLDGDEKKFIEVYENVYIMQGLSLLSMIPAAYYMIRTQRYNSSLTQNIAGFTAEGHRKLSKRLVLYLSFGTVLAINSQVYSYSNGLSRLFKEIGNRQKAAMQSGKIVEIQF